MQSYTTDDLQLLRASHVLSEVLDRYPPWKHLLTTRRLDCITKDREAAVFGLLPTIQDVMTLILKHVFSATRNRNRDINYRSCDHLTSIGYLFMQPSKSGLWLITQKLQNTSFVNIIAQLSEATGMRKSHRAQTMHTAAVPEMTLSSSSRNLRRLPMKISKDCVSIVANMTC